MSEAEDYFRRFGIVSATPAPIAPTDVEQTLPEAVRRIREGTFYNDHDYAAGPGLRALSTAVELMTEFCDRVEQGSIRSKRTYAKFCALLGRTPKR